MSGAAAVADEMYITAFKSGVYINDDKAIQLMIMKLLSEILKELNKNGS